MRFIHYITFAQLDQARMRSHRGKRNFHQGKDILFLRGLNTYTEQEAEEARSLGLRTRIWNFTLALSLIPTRLVFELEFFDITEHFNQQERYQGLIRAFYTNSLVEPVTSTKFAI